jgi:hypothetical protein
VDAGIGLLILPSAHGKCLGVYSGEDIKLGYSQKVNSVIGSHMHHVFLWIRPLSRLQHIYRGYLGNPMSESTLSPSQGLWIWPLGVNTTNPTSGMMPFRHISAEKGQGARGGGTLFCHATLHFSRGGGAVREVKEGVLNTHF